ncbi:MAG: SPOR domain-containing protein [Flavobacteriaceae bacterium]
MKNSLSHYVSELLYRYDCVIIPEFGGFVAQIKHSSIDKQAYTIHPPSKELSFNSRLVKNDGILVNFIAEQNDSTYKEAGLWLELEVDQWKKLLNFESLYLPKIGRLITEGEGQLVFEPENSTNFLTNSFGLSTVRAQENPQLEVVHQSTRTNYLKYAAIFVIGLSVTAFGFQQFNSTYSKALSTQLEQENQIKSTKIEQATFAIDNNLPAVKLKLEKAQAPKKYFVITGAFRNKQNALKQMDALQNKGYEQASIIGENKWKLHQVSAGGFSDRLEANVLLQKIRQSGNKEAWVFELK